MNDDTRAEIEALAAQGCCGASVRYVSSVAVTQFQCQRPRHDGNRHEDEGCTWIGPAVAIERKAS